MTRDRQCDRIVLKIPNTDAVKMDELSRYLYVKGHHVTFWCYMNKQTRDAMVVVTCL